jgi:hypothetical protein
MNVLRFLESTLAARLGTTTALQTYAATDTAEMGAKPYIVVSAAVEGRKGTLYTGTVDCRICYMPEQGTDGNGSDASIFDYGDTVENDISDNSATLDALNIGTTYGYMTLRFAGCTVEADGDRGRDIVVSGYWSGFRR